MKAAVRFTVAVALLFSAVPAGASTTFGLLDWTSDMGGFFYPGQCANAPCLLYSQNPVYAAPADGVIVRWQADTTCGVPGSAANSDLRLRVFRRVADHITLAGSSATITRNACASIDVATGVSVHAGDEIGIEVDAVNFAVTASHKTPGSLFRVYPLPAVGVEGDDGSELQSNVRLLLRAVLEPDFDTDGLGDETQDSDDDGDGILDATEVASGSNPLDTDSDDDGVADGSDQCRLTAGAAPSGCPADSDGDGLTDARETALGSNPNNVDSDGDGVADGADQCINTAGIPPAGCPAADLPPSVSFTAPAANAAVPSTGTKLTATAGDDHGVAVVEFIDDDAVLCRVSAAPYECQYTPGDDDVGTNLLVALAIDTGGQQSVALRTLTVSRFAATGLTNNSSRSGRTITTSGELTIPAGFSRKNACAGRLSIRIKAGKSMLSQRNAKLTGDCRYRSTVTLPRGPKLRVSVRFTGNSVLLPLRGPTRKLR